MKKYLLYLLLVISFFSFSQSETESLLSEFKRTKSDTQKITLLVNLSEKISPQDPLQGLAYAKQALQLYKESFGDAYKLKVLLKTAFSFEDAQQNDSALYYYTNYANHAAIIKDSSAMAYGLNMMGSMRIYQGEYPQAMKNCNDALKLSEKTGDTKNMAIACNNIGNLFYYQGDRLSALKYWGKAVELNRELKNMKNTGKCLSNMAAVYNELQDFKKARELLYEALSIHIQENDMFGITNVLTNIGLSYAYSKDFKSALKIYNRAYKIADSIGDQKVKVAQLTNMGEAYYELGDLKGAIRSYGKSDSISIAIKIPEGRREALFGLSEAYYANGDYKMAYATYKTLSLVSDSLTNLQIAKQTTELETQYQTDKKIQENKTLSAQNKASEAIIKQQQLTTYFIIAGLFFVLIISVILFRNYQIKKKANEELSIKNELISAQKEIVEQQKELIEEKQKEVMDSIRYARRIQSSLLAPEKYIQKNIERLKSGKNKS